MSSEEDNEMVRLLKVKMAEFKNINEELSTKLLEKDENMKDVLDKGKMADMLSKEMKRKTEELVIMKWEVEEYVNLETVRKVEVENLKSDNGKLK